jgi:hypothetical protein
MSETELDLKVLKDPVNARDFLGKLAQIYLEGEERENRLAEILDLNDVQAVCFAWKQYYELNGMSL